MKSKIFLLALPFAVSSMLLAFCSKDQSIPSLSNVEKQTSVVTERGGPCEITLTASQPARICGVIGGVSCTDCSPSGATKGVNFGPNNPHTIQGVATSSGAGSVTNLSNQANYMTVSVNGTVIQQVLLAANECRVFQFYDYIDAYGSCWFIVN
jgi:hypothetical protein